MFGSCAPVAIGLTLAGVPGAAQAQTNEGATIVVTGEGLAPIAPRSDNVVTIDRDRLTSTASNRLEDALSDVAGLQSFRRADSRSANPTSQGITLRGIGGNASSRALLILDGVPQADPFAGWVAFPAYSLARLGEVRVERGGGSGRWGSGALSGVVEMTSARPDQLAPLSASLAYGARDAIEAAASTSFVRDDGFATMHLGYARGDGFVPIVAQERGAVDRPAPFEQANIALRAVFAVAPETELQTTLQAFTDRRDRGVAFTGIESDGADASVRLVGRGRWQWSALAYVQARRFASSFASIEDDRSSAAQVLDQYNVPSTGLGGRIELSPPIGADWRLRIGGDTRVTSGTTKERYSFVAGDPTRRREAGGETQTLGGFAEIDGRIGALHIDATARIDRWWIRDGRLFESPLAGDGSVNDTRFADRAGVEPTGRFGIALPLGQAVTLRGAAYRGWRLPTPNELYRPFRAGADATGANAGLAPETLRGIEAGFDLAAGNGLSLGVTAFANRLDDAIANVTVARGPGTFPGVGFVSAAGFYRRRDNLDAIESRGVEVDGRATVGNVAFGLSYAYADARVDAGNGAAAPLDGLRPAQVPEHQAAGSVAWSRDGWRAATTLRYVSSQFEDDQNSRSLDEALTVDAVAALPIDDRFTLGGRVENLFDARVETGFSGDAIERARPRQWWIEIRARLN